MTAPLSVRYPASVSIMTSVLEVIKDEYSFEKFTTTDFVEWVCAIREIDIQLVPWEMPADVFGACICGRISYYIFYDVHSSPIAQRQIILHELCHILLGHKTLEIDSFDPCKSDLERFPSLSRDVPRPPFVEHQECEAELLASLISQELSEELAN